MTSGKSGEKTIKVTLLGTEYKIRSHDEDKVKRVADYLNLEFEKLKSSPSVLNRVDLCLMAAFKAASDFFEAKEELLDLKLEVESKAGSLSAIIDDNLTRRA